MSKVALETVLGTIVIPSDLLVIEFIRLSIKSPLLRLVLVIRLDISIWSEPHAITLFITVTLFSRKLSFVQRATELNEPFSSAVSGVQLESALNGHKTAEVDELSKTSVSFCPKPHRAPLQVLPTAQETVERCV